MTTKQSSLLLSTAVIILSYVSAFVFAYVFGPVEATKEIHLHPLIILALVIVIPGSILLFDYLIGLRDRRSERMIDEKIGDLEALRIDVKGNKTLIHKNKEELERLSTDLVGKADFLQKEIEEFEKLIKRSTGLFNGKTTNAKDLNSAAKKFKAEFDDLIQRQKKKVEAIEKFRS